MSKLSLYFHIPFCLRRCNYCAFYSTTGRRAEIPGYIDTVIRELEYSRHYAGSVETVYFGGGTPSLVDSPSIGKVLDAINRNFHLCSGAEITLEANPGTIDRKYLKAIRHLGINRLSIGAQSMDDRELNYLGRSHSVDDVLRSVIDAREAGFENLNLDLMYGLPGRDICNWKHILRTITNIGTEHLSLYGLTIEENTPLGEYIKQGRSADPDPDAAAEEYEMASRELNAAGYRQYEISNWARPGKESRHNIVYWRRGDYLGLGVGAHSFMEGVRFSNGVDIDSYCRAISNGERYSHSQEIISESSALSETLFLGLRLSEGVSIDDISDQFSIDLLSRFATEIDELTSLNLIEIKNRYLRLTARGRLLGNEVFTRFLTL